MQQALNLSKFILMEMNFQWLPGKREFDLKNDGMVGKSELFFVCTFNNI